MLLLNLFPLKPKLHEIPVNHCWWAVLLPRFQLIAIRMLLSDVCVLYPASLVIGIIIMARVSSSDMQKYLIRLAHSSLYSLLLRWFCFLVISKRTSWWRRRCRRWKKYCSMSNRRGFVLFILFFPMFCCVSSTFLLRLLHLINRSSSTSSSLLLVLILFDGDAVAA